MKLRPFLIHALSPLHAGTGQAADVIDLPIARMRSTGIPIVPGSSIKGVMRDASRPTEGQDKAQWLAIFGPEQGGDADPHAGALQVHDARLLALPVRSFVGTFAWVTSPLLLRLAERDLRTGIGIPEVGSGQARTASDANVYELKAPEQGKAKVFLEDIDLDAAKNDSGVVKWAEKLSKLMALDLLRKRLVVVDDETMTFLWETATQIDTRVRLDTETRTVVDGALWVEESLPPETLLLGLLSADRSRRSGVALEPEQVLDKALAQPKTLQIGGKATVGRGLCSLIPVKENTR